jgi:hypothetical protein
MTPDGTPIPIACTLEAGSLAERAREWRSFVTSCVVEVEAGATKMRMVLADTPTALAMAASLGQREKRCCEFFDVSIELEAERRSLVLRVPAGAEEAMATFAALLTS